MFNLSNLDVDLQLGYEFITEPAVIADLGFLNFSIDQLSIDFNLTTYWTDKNISINVTQFMVDIYDFQFEVEGVNDFIYVTINFIDSWVGPVSGRFKDLIESYIKKLVPVINRALDLIPNHINIPGTALNLDLGFANNIQCVDNSFMYLPLAVMIQSDTYPFKEDNIAVFPNFTNSTYDVEIAISEYVIDDTLYQLHKNGLIDIDTEKIIGNRLTVNLVSFGTSGDFTDFEGKAPCKVILKSLDPYPRIELNAVNS